MSTEPPKRPPTAYFKFRIDTIADLKAKGTAEKVAEKAKEMWDQLPAADKEQMQAEYQEEMAKWRLANEKWKADHGSKAQKRETRRPKSKEQEVKPEKVKGGKSQDKPEKKAEKDEKENRKERSKSRDAKAATKSKKK